MKKRMTKAEKLIEAAIDDAFKRLGYGIEFNIMDLSRVFQWARDRIAAGETVDAAMTEAVERFRAK